MAMKMTIPDGCSRCGGSHAGLEVDELDAPVEILGVQYTHVAKCPETGKGVFVRLVEDE